MWLPNSLMILMQIEDRNSTSQLSCTGTAHRPPMKSFNCFKATKVKSSTWITFTSTSVLRRTSQTASLNLPKTCFNSCLSCWGSDTSESVRTITTSRVEPGRHKKKRKKMQMRIEIDKSLRNFAICYGLWRLKRLHSTRSNSFKNKQNPVLD